MGFSLNEIEVMGKRAARGAGLPWGVAEEAGKAARWLTARGLPGAEQLADILTRNDKKDVAELAPETTGDVWQGSSGKLCPLMTGAALCDRAVMIAEGHPIALAATAQPLLLVPYAAGAAKLTSAAIALSWDKILVILTPEGMVIDGDHTALTMRSTKHVLCRLADRRPEQVEAAPSCREAGRDVDAATWSRLSVFAQRIFAPATEASRLSGAGAGLSDNN